MKQILLKTFDLLSYEIMLQVETGVLYLCFLKLVDVIYSQMCEILHSKCFKEFLYIKGLKFSNYI